MKIEQVRKHKILGLIFDTRMNWNERTNILSIKAKAEKNDHHQMPSPHQMGGRPRKPSHNTQNDNTKLLNIRRRGLRLSIQTIVKKARTNPFPRNKTGTGSVCSVPLYVKQGYQHSHEIEKPEYHNHSHQIYQQSPNTTIPLKSNQTRRIRTPTSSSKLLFVRAMEYLGKLQIDTRKIERLPQYFRLPWTKIDHNIFDYELCAI
jgi:hypothetical protein